MSEKIVEHGVPAYAGQAALSVPARPTAGGRWTLLDMGRSYRAQHAGPGDQLGLADIAAAAGLTQHYTGRAVVRIDGVLYG